MRLFLALAAVLVLSGCVAQSGDLVRIASGKAFFNDTVIMNYTEVQGNHGTINHILTLWDGRTVTYETSSRPSDVPCISYIESANETFTDFTDPNCTQAINRLKEFFNK
jgi:hypothetical protein